MEQEVNQTLEACLHCLESQGVTTVRVAVTDERVTLSEALARIAQDGTATSPALMSWPQRQQPLELPRHWWQRRRTLVPCIPGHIMQVEGQRRTARFFFGDEQLR